MRRADHERSDSLVVDVRYCVGRLARLTPDAVLNTDELLGVRLALGADEQDARTIVHPTGPRQLTRAANLRLSHGNSLARAD